MDKLEQVYAVSLYDVAKEQNQTKEVYEELKQISELLFAEKDILLLIGRPLLSKKERIDLIDSIFAHKISVTTLHFLKVLVQNGRILSLQGIVSAVESLYFQENNMLAVEITSAIPFSQDGLNKITNKLANAYGKEIVATTVVDPSLLGGLSIRANNQLLEYSVKKKLDDISKLIQSS